MYFYLTYRIPFSETDAMGVVHHSNHARYLERGRVELLRLAGMPYSEVVKRGRHVPLTQISIQFKRPLHFDDILLVETSITRLTRVRIDFAYRIFRTENLRDGYFQSQAIQGEALVTGKTEHCFVNCQGRPVSADQDILDALQKNCPPGVIQID